MWKYSWQEDSKRHRVKFIVTLLSHIILIGFFVHVEYGYIHLKCITLTFSQWLCNVDKIITLLLQTINWVTERSLWVMLQITGLMNGGTWKQVKAACSQPVLLTLGEYLPGKKERQLKRKKKKILFIWKKIPVATYVRIQML